ncbi:MAG: DUF3347 domain-containing protein [Bacteroidales bacterium]|nr:DUF3347 domain-containing protein [Bacteroidales bacterium]
MNTMKKTMILLSLVIFSWGAFAQHDHSKMGHSGMESKKKDKSSVSSSIKVEHSKSVTNIIDNYLALKNALVEDNSKKAASSGKSLYDALSKFNISAQPKSNQKELGEIIDNASENAEHISENSGKIDHQREHFESLSTDLKDLIVLTGSDRTLYQTYCPMYNNSEGGIWLSETTGIKNPFYGSQMLKCGSVQQEIAVK